VVQPSGVDELQLREVEHQGGDAMLVNRLQCRSETKGRCPYPVPLQAVARHGRRAQRCRRGTLPTPQPSSGNGLPLGEELGAGKRNATHSRRPGVESLGRGVGLRTLTVRARTALPKTASFAGRPKQQVDVVETPPGPAHRQLRHLSRRGDFSVTASAAASREAPGTHVGLLLNHPHLPRRA
jgi:hypothetical protein